MTTNANNTENIVMVIAEPVVAAEEFNMEDLMEVTVAELLEEDFSNDDEAEFLQGLMEIELAIEDIILSDTPEDFLLPTADNIAPALQLLEKLEDLKNLRFGMRTISRMERRVRGENLVVEKKLTQLEKSVHPAYKDWCCPKCLDYYKGKRCLKFHMERTICNDRHTRLVVKATTTRVVSAGFYQIANALAPLFERAEQGRRQRQLELVEEDYEEEKIAFSDSDDEETHTVTITAEEQEANDATANTYGETHLDEDGFCKYCRWCSDYQESHIQYCGYGNCVYIQEKYGVLQLQEMMEEELGEPEVEDAEMPKYEVRTWVYNPETYTIEYAGLFEVDGNDYWTDIQDAREKFNWDIETGEMYAVELIVRQNDHIIDDWEIQEVEEEDC